VNEGKKKAEAGRVSLLEVNLQRGRNKPNQKDCPLRGEKDK